MQLNLYSQLSGASSCGKKTFQQWRQLTRNDAIMPMLQLCVDMTGSGYSLATDEDLFLLEENPFKLVDDRISQDQFELGNCLQNGYFVNNLDDFLKCALDRPLPEMFDDNAWLNKVVRLVLTFCGSQHDACRIAGSIYGSTLVLHLSKVRYNILTGVERSIRFNNVQQNELLSKQGKYVDRICKAILCKLKSGFQYAEITFLLTERVCEMVGMYPKVLVEQFQQLDLLADILSLKHRKAVQNVLKTLKNVSQPSSFPISNEVSLFIISNQTIFLRVMDAFKSLESAVLALLMQACRITETKYEDQTADRIAIRIFSDDETTVNLAIEFLIQHYTGSDDMTDPQTCVVLAAVDAFRKYEYSLLALATMTAKLWKKEFFVQFNDLFQPLQDTNRLEAYSFGTKVIVHMIICCHQLLIEDIKTKLSPAHQAPNAISWNTIKTRLESFVTCYPKCLMQMTTQPDLFNLLLNCLSPEHKEYYSVVGLNCDVYYVNVLYKTLTMAVLDAKEYNMLFRILSVIHSFDTIVYISEEIWKELSENYYLFFFHTRKQLRVYNMGSDKDLMAAYTDAITRLCVLLEINSTSDSVFKLADCLSNDLRLLGRMKLSDEANAIFYRLYKNALYGCYHYMLEHPDSLHGFTKPEKRTNHVDLFMKELLEQLDANKDGQIAVGRHIVVTICDMLLLTQPNVSHVPLKGLPSIKIDQNILAKLALYVERIVFTENSELEVSTLPAKKLVLLTYNKLYDLHRALPRLTDTRHIVKYYKCYGESTTTFVELESLLNILYLHSSVDFIEVVTQVTLDFCQKNHSYNRIKGFLSNMLSFNSKQSEPLMENSKYCSTVVHRIITTLLEQYFEASDATKSTMIKLFNILQPWVKQMVIEDRKKLRRQIRHDPIYVENLSEQREVIVQKIKQFLHSLRK